MLRIFTELLTVEALKVIDRRAEVKVDFGQNVAIAVFFDILQSKLFNKCLLAVKIANLALEKHVPQNVVLLILTSDFIDKASPLLVCVDLISHDLPVLV